MKHEWRPHVIRRCRRVAMKRTAGSPRCHGCRRPKGLPNNRSRCRVGHERKRSGRGERRSYRRRPSQSKLRLPTRFPVGAAPSLLESPSGWHSVSIIAPPRTPLPPFVVLQRLTVHQSRASFFFCDQMEPSGWRRRKKGEDVEAGKLRRFLTYPRHI